MIATKLVPPRYRRKLVERQRLTGRLDEEAYRSLIFVKAPSGFGKTVLLTQWRQRLVAQGCKVGWLNLDTSDNEESQFLAYWMAALQQAGCDFGLGALAVYQRGEPSAIASFITALINDLSALEDEIYLVLEDYHRITNNTIHALVERVLDYAPTNFHLVVTSRTDLPFSLSQLRIHDRIIEIGVSALKFTHDETHTLLAERVSEKIEPEQSRMLHDATEGWVAGLQMMAMSWRVNGTPPVTRGMHAAERTHLSQAILHNTFERLPPKTTDLLLRLSIFDRFTAALCEQVIGVSDADEVLEKLAADGVLLVPLDHEEHWYRFHPLFTDYLRQRLVARVVEKLGQLHSKARSCMDHNDSLYSPQFSALLRECHDTLSAVDLPALHLKASLWFKQQGHLIEAVQHALSAGENENAYDLIETCAMEVVAAGGLNTVHAWIAKMPMAELAKRWRLRLARFWAAVLSSDLHTSASELDALADGVAVPGGISPFEFVVCRSAIACASERTGAVLELKSLWPPTGDAFHNQVARNTLIYAYASTGQYAKVKDIQAWYREEPPATWGLASAYDRGLIAWQMMAQGDFSQARQMLHEAVTIADEKSGRRSSQACALAGYLAEILYETNSLAALENLLAGRLDVMNQMVFFESLVRAYLAGARLKFVRGDLHGAFELLDRLKVYGVSKGIIRPVAESLGERIRMTLFQGDCARALFLQQQLEDVALPYEKDSGWEGLGNALEIPVTARLCRARCAIARDDAADAIQLLGEMAGMPAITLRLDITVRVQVLRAIAFARHNENEKAIQTMFAALKLTTDTGIVRSYVDEGTSCEALIKLANAHLPSTSPNADAICMHIESILNAFQTIRQPPRNLGLGNQDFAAQWGAERLSTREKDVLHFLAQGMPNKRIAATMNVSIDTVKWHLKNIFGKLEVSDRLQAVDKARRNGIILPQ